MLTESSKKLEGNDRYEGFGIEIIDELSKMNEFNYTFEIQEDGVYGSYNSQTGKWTGMMEKIMDGVTIACLYLDEFTDIISDCLVYLDVSLVNLVLFSASRFWHHGFDYNISETESRRFH